MPKVYFSDSGFRNVLLNRLHPLEERDDKGQLLENYVYNRLSKLYDKESIKFWRTTSGLEVDFVIDPGLFPERALEVKFNATGMKMTGLNKLKGNYPSVTTQVFSYQQTTNSLPILKL